MTRWTAAPNRADHMMTRGARDAMTLAIHLLRGWPSGWEVLGERSAPPHVVLLCQAQLAHVLSYRAPRHELADLELIRNRPAEIEAANMILMASRLGLTCSAIDALMSDELELREAVNGMADVLAGLAVAVWGAGAVAQLSVMRGQLSAWTLAPLRVAHKHERQRERRGWS